MTTQLNVELYKTLLQEIQCNVCLDCHTRIFQCSNGHLICEICIRNMKNMYGATKCSICRSSGGWSRNRTLENVCKILELKVPCNFTDCASVCDISKIGAHRRTCAFRRVLCPVSEDCGETLQQDLLNHLKLHPKDILEYAKNATINIRTFSQEKCVRHIIVFEEHVVVLEILFHLGHQLFDIFGKLLTNTPICMNVSNYNPIDRSYQSCSCKLDDDEMTLLLRTKLFPTLSVFQETRGTTHKITGDTTHFKTDDLQFQSFGDQIVNLGESNVAVFLSITMSADYERAELEE